MSTHSIRPAAKVSLEPALYRMPHLGFQAGGEGGTLVRFAYWRSNAAFDDWQVDLAFAEHRLPHSDEIILQNMGTGPMRFETGVWFRSRNDWQLFLAATRLSGTLWRAYHFTMHEPDDVVSYPEGLYALFENVSITRVQDQTFDNDGGVRAVATFTRAQTVPTTYDFAIYAEDE